MSLNNYHFYSSKNYLYINPVKGLQGYGLGYGFSFNGQEKDDETQTQDYGMRIYDYRLGRFLSVDPLTKEFSMLTPYQFASNTPIQAIDLDGLEAVSVSMAARAAVPICGGFGITGSAQVGLILDHQFNLVMFCIVSTGVSLGTGVSAGITITGYPTVDSYNDLMGFGASAGFISPINKIGLEGNASFSDKTHFGASVSPSVAGVSFGEAAYVDLGVTNLMENFGKISAGNLKSKIEEIAKATGLDQSEVKLILKNMVGELSKLNNQASTETSKKTETSKQPDKKTDTNKSKDQTSNQKKSKADKKEKKVNKTEKTS